jgi:hypothetical protein
MVVNNLNIIGGIFLPSKADAPLAIDSDTVLALPVSVQCLQTVTLRRSQVIEIGGRIKVVQLEKGQALQFRVQGANPVTVENLYRNLVPKAFYHYMIQPINN